MALEPRGTYYPGRTVSGDANPNNVASLLCPQHAQLCEWIKFNDPNIVSLTLSHSSAGSTQRQPFISGGGCRGASHGCLQDRDGGSPSGRRRPAGGRQCHRPLHPDQVSRGHSGSKTSLSVAVRGQPDNLRRVVYLARSHVLPSFLPFCA